MTSVREFKKNPVKSCMRKLMLFMSFLDVSCTYRNKHAFAGCK